MFDSKTKMHFPPCHVVSAAAAAVVRLVAKVITRDGRGRTDGRADGRADADGGGGGKSWRRRCGKWSVSDREGGEEAMRGRRLGRKRNEEMSGM